VWLLPYLGVLTLVHLARTLRWGCLLSGMQRVPFAQLNQASGIGFMMLLILPFRLGEFARPYLIARRSTIGRSAAMATVVLERIVDGLSVALLLKALLFFAPGETGEVGAVRLGSDLMLAIFGGGLLFLLFARWQQPRAVRWVRAVLERVSPRAAEVGAASVDRFVGALRQLPGRGAALGFFAYTAVYWGLNGFGMFVLARAFDCSGAQTIGCTPIQVTLFQAYVVLCVLVVGMMIPAAPGMVGTFQAFIKVGLGLFLPAQLVNTSGLAYANVMWLCQTAQQIILGLVLLSFSHLSFRDLAGRMQAEGVDGARTTPVSG
ncbi:MAG TPA: lysylphosphatidylglycerol synthase transmembrane domain-containing protein, partial [Myxococcaceae bacterium]|nr:lysylphosphatidylglycerol synthase transmembrane domain-containing protein [Myxococcaceae bacterium]